MEGGVGGSWMGEDSRDEELPPKAERSIMSSMEGERGEGRKEEEDMAGATLLDMAGCWRVGGGRASSSKETAELLRV